MTNLSPSGSCTVGQNHSISMTATDPDATDQVRYLIDWDNNGTVDQTVPASGYVNSGTAQSASRTWSTSGSKTVKSAQKTRTARFHLGLH